jgi:tRNA(Ile)-lysidine synthase TilS/MesJ
MKTTLQRLLQQLNRAMREFRLIEDGDRLLVALSGGKDSLCLLELLAMRRQVFVPKYSLEAIHIRMENIAYETDTRYLEDFCARLDVPLHIITTSFDASTDTRKSPCFLCSWTRRKQMFNLAQQLGCNKIALGHHMDDIVHTALMNTTFQGRFDSMPARLKMKKMPLEIIRPLCMCNETDLATFAHENGYQKQTKQCPYEHDSHRDSMRHIFEELEELNPEARHSIWNALCETGKMVDE